MVDSKQPKASKLEVIAAVEDLQVTYVRNVKELCYETHTGNRQAALILMGKLVELQYITDAEIEVYLLDAGWTVDEFYAECIQ